jgi:hypothetical protein
MGYTIEFGPAAGPQTASSRRNPGSPGALASTGQREQDGLQQAPSSTIRCSAACVCAAGRSRCASIRVGVLRRETPALSMIAASAASEPPP